VALDYIALVILIMMVALVVYGVIAVYSIPYEIAKARNHPHQDAIGAATWVSLFTLGLLWPFLWIWAMATGQIGAGVFRRTRLRLTRRALLPTLSAASQRLSIRDR
jgi:cell division protein FtsW (lipid II flippase)